VCRNGSYPRGFLTVVTRYVSYIAALVAALLVATAAPAAAAKRTVPQNFYGVNFDGDIAEPSIPDAVHDAQFAAMAEAGVETLRTSFYWAFAQSEPGAPFDHSRTDRIVQHAVAHGIEVLPVVIVAPAWAHDSADAFAPPRDPSQYAAYLTSLIGRYGPAGSFWADHPELPVRPLRQWQIWNEPHLHFQWSTAEGQDWARSYGELLRTAYKAAKAADPGSRIVLAGLANQSWKFLSRLYRKGRIKGSFDVAALHPYTVVPRGVIVLSRRFRDVMRDRGDGGKRLWITEIGLPASEGRTDSDNYLQTTDRGMAKFLEKSYGEIARTRRSRRVGVSRAYWYTWASSYSGDLFRFTGLFHYDAASGRMDAMPAFRTYRRAARRHEGCTKAPSGDCKP
jgi:hypothetical protein